jgi:hypothetical protein
VWEEVKLYGSYDDYWKLNIFEVFEPVPKGYRHQRQDLSLGAERGTFVRIGIKTE